ncbi:helix-turn-helix domain-containing protein [Streptomyces caniscabiei]|uniref:helix-turn-helix domain-containing protein n=1 Tax=Streptomyces caniscabiei TaxID=2746961 RepID=UPI0018726B51|nr:helix-turn-helix domain-containing protein [Streptomyces caniscabiei]MBE4761819.1 helix-turn-helix domain-containing protein [Streptomyces caniscabiei]MDX2947938.1 helix-turn-helix domain-containing protein [Streptomyces caniscabiei]
MAGSGKCVAPAKHCGTPYGWRTGGRCPRCRRAHNQESNHSRGLGEERRTTVLAALRDGLAAAQAAALVGVTPTSLSQWAGRDGELFAALEGQSERHQFVARQGDYLAALTRSAGNPKDAALLAGIRPETLEVWREDPDYMAMEKALLRWIRGATRPRRRPRLSADELDRAADLVEQGASVDEAARHLGCSKQGLQNAAARHERLQSVLSRAPRRNGGGRRSTLTPELEERLRLMWADPRYRIAHVAQHLGVSPHTVQRWRIKLGLPKKESGNSPAGPG